MGARVGCAARARGARPNDHRILDAITMRNKTEKSPSSRKRGHITAVDLADAEMLVDVVESLSDGLGTTRTQSRNTIARFLADKREEWISVAMLRVEATFRVKRRDET
jgi:hypothetical protein